MFCKQCGQALPGAAVFCPNCGLHVGIPGTAPYGGMLRPRSSRMFAGVCAAFSRRYGWNLTAARILMVLFGIFIFPLGEIAYLCGWLLIPEEPFLSAPMPPPPPPAF